MNLRLPCHLKTGGYYFCNHCEENAFGAFCRTCKRSTEFHPEPVTEPVMPNEPEEPAETVLTRVPDGIGHTLFADMRRKLSLR